MKKCKICFMRKYAIVKTSCKHRLCLNCIMNLTKPECPFCRKQLDQEIPQEIKFKNHENEHEHMYNIPLYTNQFFDLSVMISNCPFL